MNKYNNNTTSLKASYFLTYRIALLLSVLFISTIFVVIPRFTELPAKPVIINDRIPDIIPTPQTEQIKEQAPQIPAIPFGTDNTEIIDDFPIGVLDIDDPLPMGFPPAPKGPDRPFEAWDKNPRPIGGMPALSRALVYPAIAQEAGIEGTVIVKFYIDDRGIIHEASATSDVPGTGLEEAAIAAIMAVEWEPAYQRDRPVNIWMTMPIKFTLN